MKFLFQHKTRVVDLNRDCLILILERLDAHHLLTAAQISDQFSSAAASAFHFKYSSRFEVVIRYKDIGIVDHFYNSDAKEKIYVDFEYDQLVLPDNGDYVVKVFQLFGHVIKKLGLELYYADETKELIIGKLISKYISDSLIDISFKSHADRILTHITNPLVNVETVKFKLVALDSVPNSPMNRLFPSLRSLELNSIKKTKNIGYFYCHMPHLEQVLFEQAHKDIPLENVIKNNPQIKSVNLRNTYPEFVQMLSVHLPQLETLKLYLFQHQQLRVDICFENVTTFDIDLGIDSPKYLHFPKLQNLQLVFFSTLFTECCEFLNEHNRLKRLHLTHRSMSNIEFQHITANLMDLTEVTLQTDRAQTLSSDDIVQFLRTHKKVIQLNIIQLDDVCEVTLPEQLKHDWEFKSILKGVSFERKTNNHNLMQRMLM